MRIISDFHDFYDCVQGLDQERDIIYYRKSKELWSDKDFFDEEREQEYSGKSWAVHKSWLSRSYRYYLREFDYGHNTVSHLGLFKICFCGKVYKCLHDFSAENFFYDIKSLDDFIKDKPKSVWQRYTASKKFRRIHYQSPQERFAQLLGQQGKPSPAAEYCQIEGLPVVSTLWKFGLRDEEKRNVLHNTNLKECQFFKAKEPFTAYQEVYQFMANVAFPNRPIPEVSDKDMIVAKGFDLKSSFRKEKQK